MFRVDAELIQRTRPRLIQQWGSGLDGVDLRAAEVQNVPVANVPALGSNAESVAEHIILLMLSVLRKIPEARTNLEHRVLGAPMGRMLAGRKVCLWGLGSIARLLRGACVHSMLGSWASRASRLRARPRSGSRLVTPLETMPRLFVAQTSWCSV